MHFFNNRFATFIYKGNYKVYIIVAFLRGADEVSKKCVNVTAFVNTVERKVREREKNVKTEKGVKEIV